MENSFRLSGRQPSLGEPALTVRLHNWTPIISSMNLNEKVQIDRRARMDEWKFA